VRLFCRPLTFLINAVLSCRERVTRQQYYLQLKDNLLNHNQFVSEDKCFVLAGYALQADLGNYTQVSQDSYFDPREYFPAWVSSSQFEVLVGLYGMLCR
jgi:hypothetical protein